MRIVAVAATHRTLENFMMERRSELGFDFAVAAQTELRIVRLQHSDGREARLFRVGGRYQYVRTGQIFPRRIGVR